MINNLISRTAETQIVPFLGIGVDHSDIIRKQIESLDGSGDLGFLKGTYRIASNLTTAVGIRPVFKQGTMISVDGIAISAITKANPGIVTTLTAHGFSTGDKMRGKDIGGMVELNYSTNGGVEKTVTYIDATHFSIGDTSTYTAYTSGGYAQHILTINGTIDAGLYQIFSGNGSIAFGKGSIIEAYPEWFGASGGGAADDAFAFSALAGAILGMGAEIILSQIYKIESPITISNNMSGGRAQNDRGQFWLQSQGQIITGDRKLHWHDFKIESDVNGLTFLKVHHREFYFDHFWLKGLSDREQTGIHFDTTISGGTYHCVIDNFLIEECGYPIKITGTSAFNNNRVGSISSHFGSFIEAITIGVSGGCDVNYFGGYLEVGTTAIKTSKNFGSCVFDLYLELVTNLLDTSVVINNPNLFYISPTQWAQVIGAGSIASQLSIASAGFILPNNISMEGFTNAATGAKKRLLRLNDYNTPCFGGSTINIPTNGVVEIGPGSMSGLLIAGNDNEVAVFLLASISGAIKLHDALGNFTITKDLADYINIYRDAGTTKYTIQNKRPGTIALHWEYIGL